jgi:two-component system sensor histidine kinase VicK
MFMPDNRAQNNLHFISGGGEAGAQIRSYNWKETILGEPSTWPECLRTALSICLNSDFPIAIYWGPEYYLFYNDAYVIIAGDKHPGILGKPRKEAWPEAWEQTRPQFEQVMENGGSVRLQDKLFLIKRFGFLGESYFDYTLSPICNSEGEVCGIFNAVIETTQRVVNDRRNQLLYQLTLQSHHFESQVQGYLESLLPIEDNRKDIPFALLYKCGPQDTFMLTQAIGMSQDRASEAEWPLREVLLNTLPALAVHATTSSEALIIPIVESQQNITGLFVAGINPHIKLDDNYRQYLESVASQVAASISNGTNFDKEKKAADHIKYSEDQIQFAIDAAGLATWDLNPATNLFSGNNRLKSWFGLLPEDEIDLSKATDVIQESDRLRVIAAIQEAMSYNSGGQYDIEYTIINPNDPVPRVVKARGKALFNPDKEVTRFSGTLQDITEQIVSRKALEDAYEKARLAKEAAQLGTFDLDLVNGTMEWDDRCRLLFGISHHDEVTYEKDFLPGLHEEDRERIRKIIKNAYNKSLTNGAYDVEYRTVGMEDGQVRWVKAKGKVFFDEQDNPIRFVGSVLEITDQKENELRKNDFIGMVSHELKTPLTSLKAYVQILNGRAKKEGNSFAGITLDKVELQINKMSTMINGFLNVSRLESGKIHLDKIEFKMDDLVREIIAEAAPVMSSHTITLIPCDCIYVTADRDKIGQVINNLISNAVKYSPRGKIVEVMCMRIGDDAQVSIKDEGMGIRAQDKDRLFDRFYRVETPHTLNIAGFGIGLYLSAEIIRRHNGKIWVESEKAVGSTFSFSLPLVEPEKKEVD